MTYDLVWANKVSTAWCNMRHSSLGPQVSLHEIIIIIRCYEVILWGIYMTLVFTLLSTADL